MCRVQFLVELGSDDDGRVSGQVTAPSGPPVSFSGWLELLRVFEDGMAGTSALGSPGTPGHRADTEESTWER